MTRIFSPVVVAKFGGTSVADFDAMNRSATLVLADKQVRVVVLSASSGVTNLLVSLSEGLTPSDRTDKLETLRTLQYAILSALKQPDALRQSLDALLDSISNLAEKAATAPSAALSDELVSHGELLSSLLFMAILREREASVVWLDAREVIRTDANFGCAEPDIAAIEQQVQTHLLPHLQGSIVATQGFIGRNADGLTTTLGRGGSDYTASLLGEALSASRVDIWTDVAGIYTTDPRIVPQAQRIGKLSFREASDMAAYGAKVLHPATLMPAMRKNIPVFVGSSKSPEAGGTLVCRETDTASGYRALAVRRKQTLVTCRNPGTQPMVDFNAKIFTLLAEHKLQAELVSTSESSMAWILDATHATYGNDSALLASLQTKLAAHCQLEMESGLTLMTLVGQQISQAGNVCRDLFSPLEGYAVRMICHGAGSHNISVLLPGESADSAVKMLHRQLFELADVHQYAS